MANFSNHKAISIVSGGFAAARAIAGLGITPLFVSWNLTFRCNLRCRYCGAAEAPRRECAEQEVLCGLEALSTLGTRWITFGGGEPLLRNDIGALIRHAKKLGFQVFVSSNGRFVPDRRDEIAGIDNLNLSLDGPREIHDAVRGEGAFEATLRAVAVARESGIPVSYQCVLASHNLDCQEKTLDIALETGAAVMFQPATQWLDSSTRPNPIAPPVEAYRKTIEKLMALKKRGAPIANSLAGLRHLAQWPDPARIWCPAGRLMVVVEPDGTLLACHQCEVGKFLESGEGPGNALDAQIKEMTIPKGCMQCWCAPVVELALVCSFNPGAILNTMRRFLHP